MLTNLSRIGLYFDEVNTLRILEPQIAIQTGELSTESQRYVDKLTTFYNAANGFVTTIETIAKAVDREKMKAIGASNMLQASSSKRETLQQQLQGLIMEKLVELDKLKVELHSWQVIERDRNVTLHHLQQNK